MAKYPEIHDLFLDLKLRLALLFPVHEMALVCSHEGEVRILCSTDENIKTLQVEDWWREEICKTLQSRRLIRFTPRKPPRSLKQSCLYGCWRFCCPVFPSGKPGHALVLFCLRPPPLHSGLRAVLELALSALRVLISDMEAMASAEEHLRIFSFLHRIIRIVSSTLEPRTMLRMVVRAVRDFVPCEFCGVFLNDPKEKALELANVTAQERIPFVRKGLRISFADSLAGTVVQEKIPFLEEDLCNGTLPNFDGQLRRAGFRSTCLLPVRDGRHYYGVLTIYRKVPGQLLPLNRETLQEVAQHLAAALRNTHLRSELVGIHRELKTVQERMMIQDKLKVLGRMACGVAHDFNNALAVILGSIEHLRMRLDAKDTRCGECSRELDLIEKATEDGARMVKRLQLFGRQPARDEPLEQFDLNTILQEVLSLTRVKWKDDANRRGICYTIDPRYYPGALPVLGSATEAREAFTNLVVNALEAMPEGGELSIRTGRRNGQAVASVQDAGVGIPPEIQPKLFEPFFTTKGSRGTGLGLSITHTIVQRSGGSITVESEPGKGSTFSVTLPLATEAPRVPLTRKPLLSQKLRVLAVDDDETVLDLLVRGLKAAGHEATGYSSGREALDSLHKGSYDVLLTDLSMPQLSGLDVARLAKEVSPSLRICLLTGWGDQFDLGEDLPSAIDLVLPKPFRLEELTHTLGKLMEQKKI